MKKLLSILLTVALLLSVITLASCGLPDISDWIDDDTDEDTDDTGSHSGGDSSSVIESEDVVENKLVEFGKTTGYDITISVSISGQSPNTIHTGAKGNATWAYTNNSEGYAIVKQNGQFISLYSYYDGAWENNSNLVTDNVDSLFHTYLSGFNSYILSASVSGSSMNEVGTETVAGRSCTKLSYSDSFLTTSISYTACIDKELGITMKWSSTMSVNGETQSNNYEVTSFKTGSAVQVPDFPAPGEDYVDMQGLLGWPSNSYTALLPQMPGTVSMSGVQNSSFVAISQDVAESSFTSYIAALQAAGYEGESAEGFYYGSNSDGHSITIVFNDNAMQLTFEK